MRRRALILLLGFGTVAGFAAGFAHLHHHGCSRHAGFERHVASVCADAALRADKRR